MNKNSLMVLDVQNSFVSKKTRSLPQKIALFIENNDNAALQIIGNDMQKHGVERENDEKI